MTLLGPGLIASIGGSGVVYDHIWLCYLELSC